MPLLANWYTKKTRPLTLVQLAAQYTLCPFLVLSRARERSPSPDATLTPRQRTIFMWLPLYSRLSLPTKAKRHYRHHRSRAYPFPYDRSNAVCSLSTRQKLPCSVPDATLSTAALFFLKLMPLDHRAEWSARALGPWRWSPLAPPRALLSGGCTSAHLMAAS